MDPSANKKIKLDDSQEVKLAIENNLDDLLTQKPVTDVAFNKKVTEKLMAANPIQFGKEDIVKVITEGKTSLIGAGLPAGSSDAIGLVLENLSSKHSKMLVTMSSYLLLKSQQMSVGYNIRLAHLDHLNSVELYTQRVNAKTGMTLMFPASALPSTSIFFENNVNSVGAWFSNLKCWTSFLARVINPANNTEIDKGQKELVVKKIAFNSDSQGNSYYHFDLYSHGQCQRVKQFFFEERNGEPFNKIFCNYEVSRKERDVCKAIIGNFKNTVDRTELVSRVSFSTGRLGVKVRSGLNKKEYALFSMTYDSKIKSVTEYNKMYNQEFGSAINYVMFNGACVLVPE